MVLVLGGPLGRSGLWRGELILATPSSWRRWGRAWREDEGGCPNSKTRSQLPSWSLWV